MTEGARVQLVRCTRRGPSREELTYVVSISEGSAVHLLGCEVTGGSDGVYAVNSTVVSMETILSGRTLPTQHRPPLSQEGRPARRSGYLLEDACGSILRGRVHGVEIGLFVHCSYSGPGTCTTPTVDAARTVFEPALCGVTVEDARTVTMTD